MQQPGVRGPGGTVRSPKRGSHILRADGNEHRASSEHLNIQPFMCRMLVARALELGHTADLKGSVLRAVHLNGHELHVAI